MFACLSPSSGRELASRDTRAGAELLQSSLAGRDEVTLCARLLAYQFDKDRETDWPEQIWLMLGEGPNTNINESIKNVIVSENSLVM